MIIHLCSHFGDIEVIEVRTEPGVKTVIRYSQLTPAEHKALDQFVTKRKLGVMTPHARGELPIDEPLLEVASEIGAYLHGEKALLTAVRFSTGLVEVRKGGWAGWWKRLFGTKKPLSLSPPAEGGFGGETKPLDQNPFKQAGVEPTHVLEATGTPTPPPEVPVAAVQVPMPKRGCPMPTATGLKELKAAAVVRKFLNPVQAVDFDRSRAFIAVGCDTGHRYRVTSRWNKEVERLGVLRDIEEDRRICASNLVMPPSEEVLSMKFAVEHFEAEFLQAGHGRGF